MDNSITGISAAPTRYIEPAPKPKIIPTEMGVSPTDIVDLGKGGNVSSNQAMGIVYERAMAKLKSVVDDARAQLGIPEGATVDTSPEATAQRITDFALGAFTKWREKHTDLNDQDARKQFASFIGGAINEGINQAQGILGSLNALNGDVQTKIQSISDLIGQRLGAFVEKGQ